MKWHSVDIPTADFWGADYYFFFSGNWINGPTVP